MTREVCQHCYTERGIGWMPSDTERWKSHELICPRFKEDGDCWGILSFKDDGINILCPFVLEHLILRQGREG